MPWRLNAPGGTLVPPVPVTRWIRLPRSVVATIAALSQISGWRRRGNGCAAAASRSGRAWLFCVVHGVACWWRAGLLVSRRCRVVGSREPRYASVAGQCLLVSAGGRGGGVAAAVSGCDGCGPGCHQRGSGERLGACRGGRGGVPGLRDLVHQGPRSEEHTSELQSQ